MLIDTLISSPIFTKPPCNSCRGACCSIGSGFKFVQLTPREQNMDVFKGRVETHKQAGVVGFFFLSEGNGGYCPFFDQHKKQCGIYENRPLNCKLFDCRSLDVNSEFFMLNKDVLEVIAK